MFLQKDTSASTIKDVVEKNTGMCAEDFLRPVIDPYIKNLHEAVELLNSNTNKTVHIIGDYDADGIMASLIMCLGLKKYGFDVRIRLPKRFSEGYGLSEIIIDEIDSGVVLTVDNGIAAFSAIQKAKEKGLVVIITDHHLAPTENGKKILPNADIIVDPAVEDDSEFHDYCGAAIAYRFVRELLPDLKLIDLQVMASIATVADVMPLKGANRTLVKDGLEAINAGRGVPALRQMLKYANMNDHISENDYGFTIAPMVNAPGRLYDDGASFILNTLLMGSGNPSLTNNVMQLFDINKRRKSILSDSIVIADTMITEERPIVIYNPKFGEGIIGLIAGRYCESEQCPVIVFTKTEDGNLKGSGRSIPEIHMKKVLDSIKHTMIGYGGHAGAAGIKIRPEMFDAFKQAFINACGVIPEKRDRFPYDLEVPKEKIPEFLEEQEIYAPYGEGNPKVSVLVRGIEVKNYRRIGDGTHFMIYSDDLTLMGFGLAQKYESAGSPKKITCVGYLSFNHFNGNQYSQMEVKDFEW